MPMAVATFPANYEQKTQNSPVRRQLLFREQDDIHLAPEGLMTHSFNHSSIHSSPSTIFKVFLLFALATTTLWLGPATKADWKADTGELAARIAAMVVDAKTFMLQLFVGRVLLAVELK